MHLADKAFHDACAAALDQAAPCKGLASAVVYMPRHGGCPPFAAQVTHDSWYLYAQGRGGRRVVARGVK